MHLSKTTMNCVGRLYIIYIQSSGQFRLHEQQYTTGRCYELDVGRKKSINQKERNGIEIKDTMKCIRKENMSEGNGGTSACPSRQLAYITKKKNRQISNFFSLQLEKERQRERQEHTKFFFFSSWFSLSFTIFSSAF